MTTNKKTRIRVAPGLYRRGDIYEIRVGYRDPATGKRRERWDTIGPSKTDAKRALTDARGKAQNGAILAHSDENLTVSEFLRQHFLPYLDEERVAKAKNLHPNTALKYRSYVENKVIPVIGGLRVAQVNPGHIEGMLNQLRVGGRDPDAGAGVSRRRPAVIYDLIADKRSDGWSYDDITVWLAATRPGDCAGLTKDAVAAVCRRSRLKRPGIKQSVPGLSVATVQKIHAMMRSAWRFGVNHGMIPRDRAYVIAEAPVPSRSKHEPESEIAVWTERDYSRFFDWAVIHRPDSWPAFFFVATSGDRISGNLGLRWPEVDLDSGTASLRLFVKYHGRPGKRVLVEPFGKTTAGHQIFLDLRTVAILRSLKAHQAQELLARSDRHVCTTLERDCCLPGYHDRGWSFLSVTETTATPTSSSTCSRTPSGRTTGTTPPTHCPLSTSTPCATGGPPSLAAWACQTRSGWTASTSPLSRSIAITPTPRRR